MINDAEDLAIKAEIARRGRQWDQRFAELERQLAHKTELIKLAQRQTAAEEYARRRKAELRDEIAPELLDYIGGDSIEAVERSIDRAKAKTSSIVAGLREGLAAQPVIQVPQFQRSQQPQPTIEDLSAIEVGSPQHLALRRAAGIDRARGQGLFQ